MRAWIVVLTILFCSCANKQPEGSHPADCSDSKDNDNDGRYDCEDDGCLASDVCVEKKRLAELKAAAAKKEKTPQVTPTSNPEPGKQEKLDPYFPVGQVLVQRSQNGENINWMNANSYCESLNLAGMSGWRLPTQKEAVKIVESGILTNEPSYVMWTSTKMGTKRAVIVGITGGAVNHVAVQSKGECRARCVRDAK